MGNMWGLSPPNVNHLEVETSTNIYNSYVNPFLILYSLFPFIFVCLSWSFSFHPSIFTSVSLVSSCHSQPVGPSLPTIHVSVPLHSSLDLSIPPWQFLNGPPSSFVPSLLFFHLSLSFSLSLSFRLSLCVNLVLSVLAPLFAHLRTFVSQTLSIFLRQFLSPFCPVSPFLCSVHFLRTANK